MRCPPGWMLVVLISCATCHAGEVRNWTDTSGQFRIDAELESVDGLNATLRTAAGRSINVPIYKLSDADQQFIAAAVRNGDVEGELADDAAPANAGNPTSNEITTYQDLAQQAGEQREASFALKLYEGFLATDGIDEAEQAQARADLPTWQERANNGAIRVGRKWMPPDQFQQIKQDEIRLIKEAHRLIDIKSDELAKDKFLEASKINPQGVRADFYLGLLNSLVAHHPHDADEHFSECVKRLIRDDDLLTGTRKANYVAALNNLALVEVRRRQYNDAIRLWRRAIDIAPFTPELVQNLGLMVKLAETARYVRIPRGMRRKAGDLYARVTVQNSLARFDDEVGWLVIPFIDTLDGSMDESGDEELVTVAWCSGFAVGRDYVLTSRYPLVDADRVVVQQGGNTFEVPSGKVVAVSDKSNLVLLRIDGLGGTPFPLSTDTPKPAQDVLIAGYREPGFTNETFQLRNATIVDLPNVWRHVDTSSFQTGHGVVHYRIAHFRYRDMVMHDAITSAGMEGAPLVDSHGHVVGVHIGNRPAFGTFGSKFSLAEPAQYAIDFLKPILNDLDVRAGAADTSKPAFDSQQLQQQVKTAVYQLAVQRRAPRLAWSHRIEELHRLQQQGSWTSYEDRTCMACNGAQKLDCPGRGCTRGVVRKRIRVEIARDDRTGSVIYDNKTVTEECPVCNGKGTVRCDNCIRGIDKMLR